MKKIQLAMILFMAASCADAQQLKLNEKFEIKLRSNSEEVDHTIFIQLPKSYGKLHTQFPVIVLLDAQDRTLFDYASATVDRLMFTNDIPEAIFVGVLQNDRGKELSVEKNEETALKFQQFLKTELYNLLQKKYQAGSYFTFIGHSLGGQFVTNAMISDPNFFRSVISISGALNYPADYTFFKRKVLGGLQKYLISRQRDSATKQRQKYYFSAGSDGYQESGFKSGALNADSLLKRYPNKYLNWQFDFLPGFNHMTTPLPSIPAGLVFIFKDWHFTDSLAMEVLLKQTTDPIDAINKHKIQIEKSYGNNLALPYSCYYQFAKFYIQKGDLVKAKIIGQNIVEQYPDDDETYGMIGEILVKQGDRPAALRYYKLAQSKSKPEKYLKEITDLEPREK
jgi:predicted alpha/beta superfamily hydrolase